MSDLSRALEYDQESVELGRSAGISNVEISALINVGLDHFALGQHEQARLYLEPTLERVEREASGAHRWRWRIRLLSGLAELAYTTGAYASALRYVEEALREARATSSQKYVALGWALYGKIAAQMGDTETTGTALQWAFSLAEALQSPSLLYPMAYDLGHWYESTGKAREARTLYAKAQAITEWMAMAVEDATLRDTFSRSALVQTINERVGRPDE